MSLDRLNVSSVAHPETKGQQMPPPGGTLMCLLQQAVSARHKEEFQPQSIPGSAAVEATLLLLLLHTEAC